MSVCISKSHYIDICWKNNSHRIPYSSNISLLLNSYLYGYGGTVSVSNGHANRHTCEY